MASALILVLAVSAFVKQVTRPDGNETETQSVGQPIEARVSADHASLGKDTEGDAAGKLGLAARDDGTPPWDDWANLDAKRVASESSHERVRVVASRIPDGLAVGISNVADAPASLRLEVRLPRGMYTIERLVLGDAGPRVERLQSAAVDTGGSIKKPGYLGPGTCAVFRFVNHASRASNAYRRAAQQSRAYRVVSASSSARLVSALKECPWMLNRISKLLAGEGAGEALAPIHRAILGVRHAQAVCGNMAASGKAATAMRDRIAAELDELESSLGECSVAALGLVPSAYVSENDGSTQVRLSVRNSGGESVSAVKLWLTGPRGCAVEPSLQAVFDVLRPGQTATADFTASMAGEPRANGADTGQGAPAGLKGALCGHLSYFRGQAPAHVRIEVR